MEDRGIGDQLPVEMGVVSGDLGEWVRGTEEVESGVGVKGEREGDICTLERRGHT